jgi:hypothetical protein
VHALSILTSAIVFAFDGCMAFVVNKLADLEIRSTHTRKEIGVAIKLILVLRNILSKF